MFALRYRVRSDKRVLMKRIHV